MSWRIPLYRIFWDVIDIEMVQRVIEKGTDWAIGGEIVEFENKVCDYLGASHAAALNSGTSALHVALDAHGIGKGDEVIVPSCTFIATANAPLFVGAVPVFAEIEDMTYGLDPEDVRRKITARTKAIIAVHYGGCACRIGELKDIALEHGLILIEDAAEAFGASVHGKKLGTIGDSAVLSFCANKVITTGEGGMIITGSPEVIERAKLLRSHGREERSKYFATTEKMDYVTLGYNFRMSTMTAALGMAQMSKVDKIIEMRRGNAEYMNRKLSDIDLIQPPVTPEDCSHVYQLYTIRVVDDGGARDALMQYLIKKGIMVKVYFDPVHLTTFYREKFGYGAGHLPVTEKISSELLTLPMYPGLKEEEMDYIVESIREFIREGNH